MIKIISFIDSYKHFDIPIKEYEKRLSKDVIIQKLKPQKWTPQEIVRKETEDLKKVLQKEKTFKVLLFIDSKEYSTENFVKFVDDKLMNNGGVTFIIWWAYWVNYEEIKNEIDFKISLSPMTFPHIMALQILLEQLYRVKKIKEWWGYHH